MFFFLLLDSHSLDNFISVWKQQRQIVEKLFSGSLAILFNINSTALLTLIFEQIVHLTREKKANK